MILVVHCMILYVENKTAPIIPINSLKKQYKSNILNKLY